MPMIPSMSQPLVLLIDPRRDFREAFKTAARGSLRVLAYPDVPGALGALDRHHPTAVLAAMKQNHIGTDGAQLCGAARTTLRDGLFIAYGPSRSGQALSAGDARAARAANQLDDVITEDVTADDLVDVVRKNLGVEAEESSATPTGFVKKLRLAFNRRAEA